MNTFLEMGGISKRAERSQCADYDFAALLRCCAIAPALQARPGWAGTTRMLSEMVGSTRATTH